MTPAELQAARSEEVLVAEAKCKATCESPLARKPYPNNSYWDRVGPMLDGRLYAWRQEDALKVLDDELDEITLRYQALLDDLE